MEEAQLCCTRFVLHCPGHTPVRQGWLRQAAHGHHQLPGKASGLPRACRPVLGKTEWGEERRTGTRERRKGEKGEKKKKTARE